MYIYRYVEDNPSSDSSASNPPANLTCAPPRTPPRNPATRHGHDKPRNTTRGRHLVPTRMHKSSALTLAITRIQLCFGFI